MDLTASPSTLATEDKRHELHAPHAGPWLRQGTWPLAFQPMAPPLASCTGGATPATLGAPSPVPISPLHTLGLAPTLGDDDDTQPNSTLDSTDPVGAQQQQQQHPATMESPLWRGTVAAAVPQGSPNYPGWSQGKRRHPAQERGVPGGLWPLEPCVPPLRKGRGYLLDVGCGGYPSSSL